MTPEQLDQKIAQSKKLMAEDAVEDGARLAKEEARIAKEKAAKQAIKDERFDLGGYEEGLSGIDKARVIKTLNKKIKNKGW